MSSLNSGPRYYRAYRHSQGRVNVALVEVKVPEPGTGVSRCVLVRPRYVGVCSADIREVRGERPGRSDFGHEVVGTVVESTDPNFVVGESVVLNPFERVERETAYAELMYVTGSETALRASLIKVPSAQMHYAIAEPLACVIHAARKACSEPNEPKLIFGAGFFGFLLYHYFDHFKLPVTLANRSADRLTDLTERSTRLRVLVDLGRCEEQFATVFLMQSLIDREHLDTAARLARHDGEIVLFGALDGHEEPQLHLLRRQQRRAQYMLGGKNLYLQGTLDAVAADLKEAIGLLGQADFVRGLDPILAPPLDFSQGAEHLSLRASSPRSYRKYMVDMLRGVDNLSSVTGSS